MSVDLEQMNFFKITYDIFNTADAPRSKKKYLYFICVKRGKQFSMIEPGNELGFIQL